MAKKERKTAQDIFAERERNQTAAPANIVNADERYEIDETADESYEVIEQQEQPAGELVVVSDGGAFAHEFIFTVRAEELFNEDEVDAIFCNFELKDGEDDKVSAKGEFKTLRIERSGIIFKFSKKLYEPVKIKITAPFIKDCDGHINGFKFCEQTVFRSGFYEEINRLIQVAIKTTPALYNEIAGRLSAAIEINRNTAANAVAENTARTGAILMRMRDEKIFPGGMNYKKGEKIIVKDKDGKEKEVDPFYAWAEAEHDYKQSAVDHMIGFTREFCLPAADGSVQVKEEYKEYNYSQLLAISKYIKKGLELPPASVSSREMERQLKADKNAEDETPAVTNDFDAAEIEEYSDVEERLPGGAPISPEAPGVKRIDFKNDEDRKQFLKDYQNWKLWKTDLSERLYVRRCALQDGSVILAKMRTYLPFYGNSKNADLVREDVFFYLYEPKQAKKEVFCFRSVFNSENEIVNYIRENKLYAVI